MGKRAKDLDNRIIIINEEERIKGLREGLNIAIAKMYNGTLTMLFCCKCVIALLYTKMLIWLSQYVLYQHMPVYFNLC